MYFVLFFFSKRRFLLLLEAEAGFPVFIQPLDFYVEPWYSLFISKSRSSNNHEQRFYDYAIYGWISVS